MKLIVEELIIKSGMTKRFVAKQIGVNENTLKNWCQNRSWPKLNQAVKLADVLRCEITDLYERKDNND